MNWWKDHGTKFLGGLTAATQVIQATDPTVLASAIGPKGLNYVGVFLGFMTVVRGFQNSANQQPPTIR